MVLILKKIYLFGNWKMNHGLSRTDNFFKEFNNRLVSNQLAGNALKQHLLELAFFPPYVSVLNALGEIASEYKDSIFVGAQNAHQEDQGAYTGEISIEMLKELGCKYVIIGHSERRHIFGETNPVISAKIEKCIEKDIIPVLCYGETLKEKEDGLTIKVIEEQLKSAVDNISTSDLNDKKIIFAYEPVWAIGTGLSATPLDAENICRTTRDILKDTKGSSMSRDQIILYGGSVKEGNAKDLINQENIDGALIGGASLKVDSFFGIINSCLGQD